MKTGFIVGEEVILEVYPEICCEECGEVIHNHINCLICKDSYASTDKYYDLEDEKELSCEECGTVYAIKGDYWYSDCKAKIVLIGKGEIK
ncbi:hypothetical protein H8D85_02080 [bacterium]|nr:hypothetical protein [bacterium]